MATRDPKIVFAASLSRMTADGEQLTVNFNAENPEALEKRLLQVVRVCDLRMRAANAKVLDATEEMQRTAEQMRGKIARDERLRLANAGLIPRELVDPKKEPNGADAATGAPDLRADS